MTRGDQLYEGKAKRIFATDDPHVVIHEYKDDATAFNAQKRGTIAGKGEINAATTAHLMRYLESHGIVTHLIDHPTPRELVTHKVEIVMVEVIVRNLTAGSMAKRLGLAEGLEIPIPIVEYSLKSDELGDPLMNAQHALFMGLATRDELDLIESTSRTINELLRAYLLERGLILVDFKLEFGRDREGKIVLADEISPDTCRFWDRETRKKLDKDRFRHDLGDVAEAYHEVHRRILGS
ncbi:MAG: phosphoribosylaminoimidazolesuccinocarboxamide synthase [Gemmatimonadetes bacterium]|nr:phosphoribosylaminoimidazolesuccinocarboxamide synthase [Gemmatimonadota bacterium]